MIHVIAIITAKPGHREEVIGHFKAIVPAVHAEKGCIEYRITVDADAGQWIDAIAARLATGNPHAEHATTLTDPATIAANPATTPEHFAAMVATAKDYIAAGDIFQVVLSQRFS
eukprot:gene16964-21634_t